MKLFFLNKDITYFRNDTQYITRVVGIMMIYHPAKPGPYHISSCYQPGAYTLPYSHIKVTFL